MNAKKLQVSTFQKMKGKIVDYIRARERLYVKDNLGLN